MKIPALSCCLFSIAATLLCGCGESKQTDKATDTKPSSSSVAAQSTAPTTPPAAAVPAKPAPAAPATAQTETPSPKASPAPTATDPISEFVTAAKAQGDKVLSSIGADLADKAKTLSQ